MTKAELTQYEKSILLFFIKGTLSDLSKSLIFFFVFFILGFLKEFFYGLFFLFLFRIFSGGIHCKTYLKCLLVSFVILSSGIGWGCYILIPHRYAIILATLCGIITVLLTPTLAPTRPAPSKKNKNRAKLHEGIVIFLFIILLTFKYNVFVNIGLGMLILHTIQLIVAQKRI
ncbi:MAG: accessory gene regulator B family protein [Lachnospiraceae bacterium]|nr:accessory gene regulator B family protein [Lachnospiraceae bacterium]MBQ8166120.1 accessory gene regulator B family protein [Lachnospiraceae bacterium]